MARAATTAKKTAEKIQARKKSGTRAAKDTVSLETVLWNCRVALRGVGSTEKNRDAVIGLVFLKFAGDKFARRRAAIAEQYAADGAELVEILQHQASSYNAENVFYLTETARWDYIALHAAADDIAVLLDQAMADIEDRNPALAGTLPANLYATLGADKSKLKSLIDEVNKIDESRFHEEDLIGRVYEYFLQIYAASGTKEDGEFYTPACVVRLIAEMIEPYSGIVYDPCCGSGGMFVQSLKFVDRHHGSRRQISILGQESTPDTWRLCKMNLAIRGIAHDLGTHSASTFTDDQHPTKTVDFIMANPPFNFKGWRKEDELRDDPRWRGYVLPRAANANYAWILHMISKLRPAHGIAGFLLANGALSDPDEYENRKRLIENDRVEAIIVLPRDMFYTTDISVTLWIVNMDKGAGERHGRQVRDRRGEILFVDLRTWNSNVEEIVIDKNKRKKKTVLTDAQITAVKELYDSWQSSDTSRYRDVPEYCRSATLAEVRAQDYSLAPSKYIEFIDHDLEIDYAAEMERIQGEMRDILRREKASQTMLANAFREIGYGID